MNHWINKLISVFLILTIIPTAFAATQIISMGAGTDQTSPLTGDIIWGTDDLNLETTAIGNIYLTRVGETQGNAIKTFNAAQGPACTLNAPNEYNCNLIALQVNTQNLNGTYTLTAEIIIQEIATSTEINRDTETLTSNLVFDNIAPVLSNVTSTDEITDPDAWHKTDFTLTFTFTDRDPATQNVPAIINTDRDENLSITAVRDAFGNTIDVNRRVRLDKSNPIISNREPAFARGAAGSNNPRQAITAIVQDANALGVASGINPASIILKVNEQIYTIANGIDYNGVDNNGALKLIPTSDLNHGINKVDLNVQDHAGNDMNVQWTFELDLNAPTISANIGGTYEEENGWILQNVNIALNPRDDIGLTTPHTYRINGQAWQDVPANNQVNTVDFNDGINTVDFNVSDTAGNIVVYPITFKLDRWEPVTTIDANTDWRNTTPFNVTLFCDDRNGSGCHEIYYKIDNNAWRVSTLNPVRITITDDGEHTIQYYSVDKLGHNEAIKQSSVRLDARLPHVEFIWPRNNETTDNARIIFKVNGSLVGSQIVQNSITLKINGVTSRIFENTKATACTASGLGYVCSYEENVRRLTAGDYNLTVSARDQANNSNSASIVFKVVQALAVDLNVVQPNGNQYLQGIVPILFDVNSNGLLDLNANIAIVNESTGTMQTIIQNYDLNGQTCAGTNFNNIQQCRLDWNTAQFVGNVDWPEDGNYLIRVTVNGNAYDLNGVARWVSETDQSDHSFMADNTVPSIQRVDIAPANNWYTEDMNADIRVTDMGTGIARVQYQIDNQAVRDVNGIVPGITDTIVRLPLTFDGNHFVQIIAYDMTGNRKDWNTNIQLDKSKPEFSSPTPARNGFINQADVNISIMVTNGLSGVDGNTIILRVNGNPYRVNDNPTHLDYNNGLLQWTNPGRFNHGQIVTVIVSARDIAGNYADYNWMFTVDVLGPTIVTDLTARLMDVNGDWVTELQFTNPIDVPSGIAGYNVYRNTVDINAQNKTQSKLNAQMIPVETALDVNTGKVTIIDRTMELDQVYQYKVTAVDKAGNESELSNASSTNTGDRFEFMEVRALQDKMVMGTTDTVNVVIKVKNISSGSQCLKLKATVEGEPYIRVRPETQEVCLGIGQDTLVSVQVQTLNAPAAEYNLDVTGEALNGTHTTDRTRVRLLVGVNGTLNVTAPTGSVCRGKFNTVSANIRNSTDDVKRVEINPSSLMFVSTVDRPELELLGGQSKTVNISTFVPNNTPVGDYTITLYIASGSEMVQQELHLNVQDCSVNNGTPTFTVRKAYSGNECKSVRKEVTDTVDYSIENVLDETQTIEFSTVSTIESSVRESVTLEPRETKVIQVNVKPSVEDNTGTQTVDLYAWSTAYVAEPVQTCVNVQGMAYAQTELIDNDVLIERGSEREFEVLVTNNGDSTQTFRMRPQTTPQGVHVSFSDDDFNLNAGQEKRVRIIVTTSNETEVKSYELPILIQGQPVSTVQLKFNVVPSLEGNLELSNYPTDLEVARNGSKLVTVTVSNLSNTLLENIEFGMERLPQGVNFAKRRFTLAPGESITLTQRLSASESTEPGEYEVRLKAKADTLERTEYMTLAITQATVLAQAGTVNGTNNKTTGANANTSMAGQIAAGLVGLGQSVPLGILLILIVVIVFFALRPAQSETPWMRK